MAFRFQVELAGAPELDVGFSRFGENIQDLTPAWELIADDWYAMELDLFKSQGATGTEAWKPLAPSTLRRKKGPSILNETGALQKSLTLTGGKNIKVVKKMELRLGTKDPKAKFHFYGTRRMPRRRPIQITENDKKRWIKLMQRHLVSVAREAGFLSYGG